MIRDVRNPESSAKSDEHRRALEHRVALVRRAGVRGTAEPRDRRDVAGNAEDADAASGR